MYNSCAEHPFDIGYQGVGRYHPLLNFVMIILYKKIDRLPQLM